MDFLVNSRSVSDSFMIGKYLAVAPILTVTLRKPNALMPLIYSLAGQTTFFPFYIGVPDPM